MQSNAGAAPSIQRSPSIVLPSYALLDLDAGMTNGGVALKAFARNLANKRAYMSGGVALAANQAAQQINYALAQPRTIGVGCDYTF